MHRVKNLNFLMRVPELHSVFHVIFLLVALHPLLVALHPLTVIEQVIYRWKSAVNTQLSRVDHFYHTRDDFKSCSSEIHSHSSRTSCCFHVELLWRFSFVSFSSISSVLHKWYAFCTNLSHNIFLTFCDRGLELTTIKNI